MNKHATTMRFVGLMLGLLSLGSFGCDLPSSECSNEEMGSTGDLNSTGDGSETDGLTCSLACSPGTQDCANPEEKCTPYLCQEGCCTDATHCVSPIGNRMVGEACFRDAQLGNDDCAKGLFCQPNDQMSGATGPGICHPMCKTQEQNMGVNHCVELGFSPDHACFVFNNGSFPTCLPTEDLNTELGEIENPENAGQACTDEMSCGGGMGCVEKSALPGCQADCEGAPVCGCCAVYCDVNATNPEERCLRSGEMCVALPESPPPGPRKLGICRWPD